MIEDQRQIEGGRTEGAISIAPEMRDFLDTASFSGNPQIVAVTPDAARDVRIAIAARAIAMSTTDIRERTKPLGSTRPVSSSSVHFELEFDCRS